MEHLPNQNPEENLPQSSFIRRILGRIVGSHELENPSGRQDMSQTVSRPYDVLANTFNGAYEKLTAWHDVACGRVSGDDEVPKAIDETLYRASQTDAGVLILYMWLRDEVESSDYWIRINRLQRTVKRNESQPPSDVSSLESFNEAISAMTDTLSILEDRLRTLQ